MGRNNPEIFNYKQKKSKIWAWFTIYLMEIICIIFFFSYYTIYIHSNLPAYSNYSISKSPVNIYVFNIHGRKIIVKNDYIRFKTNITNLEEKNISVNYLLLIKNPQDGEVLINKTFTNILSGDILKIQIDIPCKIEGMNIVETSIQLKNNENFLSEEKRYYKFDVYSENSYRNMGYQKILLILTFLIALPSSAIFFKNLKDLL